MPGKPRAEYEIRAKDESAAGWRSALSTADKSANRLKATLASSFAGISIGSLFVAEISKAIKFGDEMGKLAIKIGATASSTQELVAVAKQFDIEVSSLATSLRKMQVSISEATTGNKQLNETFAALGLNAASLKRLSPDRQFEVIGDAISRLKDEEDRARAATDIFGRSGTELLPAFAKGAEGIRMARQEVRQFGQILDDSAIKKLQEADDAMKKIEAVWNSIWRNLAVGVVGYGQAVASTTDKIKDLLTQQGPLASFLRGLGATSLPLVGPMLLAAEAQSRADAANAYTRGGGSRRGRSQRTAAPGFGGGAGTPDAFTSEMRENIRVAERWRALVDETDRGIGKGMIASNEAIAESFDDLQEPILKTTDAMSVFSEEAARNMQDAFAEFLFDPFENGLKGMLHGFIDIIRRMVAEAASAKIFESLGGISGLGNILGSLFGTSAKGGVGLGAFLDAFSVPKYATGTDYVPRDQLAYVHQGEKIIPAGRSGGGWSINAPMTIDARGSTADGVKELMRALPALQRQWGEQVEARIVSRLRRGYYGGARG